MVLKSERIRHLPTYTPGKPVEELQRELDIERIVKLASNETPHGPSPKAIEKIKQDSHHVGLYPDGNCFYLKQRISVHENVLPNEIAIGNGSNELLELLCHAYLDKGDEALMGEYCFIVYPIVSTLSQATIVRSKMPEMSHDLNDMADKINSNTKIIFIANPNNPTGGKISRADLENFINQTPKNTIIVIDEAYTQYVKESERLDVSEATKKHKNLLVLKTFSKAYGLAGLRVGYGVADKAIIENINKAREPFNVNALAQSAAIVALEDQKYIQKCVAMNQEGMIYLKAELNKLSVKHYPSYANFLLLEFKSEARLIYEELLKRGVIVRPLVEYGMNNHLRVTIGTEEENKIFIEALGEVI